MAPNLLDVTVNGRLRKIVAQTTKQGWIYVFDRATGEPIWPMPETPVLQSVVPGEQTSPTQPIPSKPAPYSQQGLVEADLIDYTPAIKEAALKIAKQCRMGPYFIPASLGDGTGIGRLQLFVVCARRGGWREHRQRRGGGSGDGHDLRRRAERARARCACRKIPCSEFRYSSPHDSCGLLGAPPAPPGYTPPPSTGRGRGDGGFAGRAGASAIGGVSILKPKELGGITGYDMKTGDKAWWIPNGGFVPVTSTDPLFAGVTLPPAAARGQPQVINDEVARGVRHGPQPAVLPTRRHSSSRSTRQAASRWGRSSSRRRPARCR